MEFIKDRKWPFWQIGILKWTMLLFGMLIGAYWSVFVISYAWIILALAVLGGLQVTVFYLSKQQD